MSEIRLTNEEEREIERSVKEVLVTLQKITHYTNRIKELEEDLKQSERHISTSMWLFAVLLIAPYFIGELQAVNGWMYFLFISMTVISVFTQLKITKEKISTQIENSIFHRKLLVLDVAKISIQQVDTNADYLDSTVLEKAEDELRDYLLRKYK